ncbi:unnamed protein product [Linum tenue]|uniref:Stigma-specific Stig1 family protein n=1 Tax=Linum tenue TaxID=586396 RepID=A0AAV0LQE1_9ROSI|nr:unnamed protein product [Linum tenue]
MQLENARIAATLFMPLLLFVLANGDSISKQGHYYYYNVSTHSSPWLKKVRNHHQQPRDPGCSRAPWICRDQGVNHHDPPGPRMQCCRNQCVDVSSDANNCGWCGISCPFTWQCCGGLCVDSNVSPFNCGKCFNRCPWGVQCSFGMCGYGGDQPQPWPRPWPRPPFPFPPRPPEPWPRPWPRPPFPFPPRPPEPWPRPWPQPPFPFPPRPPEPWPRPWPQPPFPFPPRPPQPWQPDPPGHHKEEAME